jgi:hypothetical protein
MAQTHLSREDVRRIINAFVDGTGGRWDWDDFISVPLKDPELERVRLLAAELPDRFPPGLAGGYCSIEGLQVLRKVADRLGQDQ